MPIIEHSLRSSHREMLLEHLFAAEIMRHAWQRGLRLEILKPQIDDGGYDVVFETDKMIRHVQLKSTFNGSRVQRFTINKRLALKPSGCVVVLIFDADSLKLGPFLWFGSSPGTKLPDLSSYRTAKHTKGNAEGTKLERPNVCVIPRSAFTTLKTIADLSAALFGEDFR